MAKYPNWIRDDAEAAALAAFATAWAKYDGTHGSRKALFAPFDEATGTPAALAPLARMFDGQGPQMVLNGADPKGKAPTSRPFGVAEIYSRFEFERVRFRGRTHSPTEDQFLALRLRFGSTRAPQIGVVAFSFAMIADAHRARSTAALERELRAIAELFHGRLNGVESRYSRKGVSLSSVYLNGYQGVDETLLTFGPGDMLSPEGELSAAWAAKLDSALLAARERIVAMYRDDHDRLVELLKPCFELGASTSAPTTNSTAPTDPMDKDNTVQTATDAIRHLKAKGAIVLQGPPGTGKTYLAEEIVRHWFADPATGSAPLDDEQLAAAAWDPTWKAGGVHKPEQPLVWAMKQLHPGYSYEDLVQGMRSEGREFKVKPQLLQQMAEDARASGRPTFLILDEINRCNLAAVLGDLLSVLEADERGKRRVQLQYEGALELPPNLYIIGTMNTADRSIALVDFAIRRRFRFLTVGPSIEAIDNYSHYKGHPDRARLARRAFEAVTGLNLPPNLALGHSFVLQRADADQSFSDWRLALRDKLVYEVVPQLAEYDREKLLEGAKKSVSAAIFGVPLTDLCKEGADLAQFETKVLTWLQNAN